MTKIVKVGDIECGSDELFLISGPCVIEDEMIMMKTAEKLKEVSERLNIKLIYKSSFQKDTVSVNCSTTARMAYSVKNHFTRKIAAPSSSLPVRRNNSPPFEASDEWRVANVSLAICFSSRFFVFGYSL